MRVSIEPDNILEAQVVAMPAVHMLSLTLIAIPSRGSSFPVDRLSSAERATFNTDSSSGGAINAFIFENEGFFRFVIQSRTICSHVI